MNDRRHLFYRHFGLLLSVTLRPSPHHAFPRTFSSWPAGDQLVAEGVTHISLPRHKNTIGGRRENKTDEQSLGLTKSRRRLCNTTCMCGLVLAWVTSKNSKSTGMPTSFDSIFFAGPYLVCYCLRSRPHLSVVPRQLCLLSRLSAVQSPTASQLLFPANSHSRPLTTSGYGEISGPKILCLVSRQNRQRNRLFGGPPI